MSRAPVLRRAALGVLVSIALLSCGGDDGSTTSGSETHPIRTEFEAIAEKIESGNNEYLGRASIERLRKRYRGGRTGKASRVDTGLRFCRDLLEAGDVDEAIEVIEEVETIIESDPLLVTKREAFHRTAALAWLRKAEVENCIRSHNKDCCVFPLAGGGKHAIGEPARKACLLYTSDAADE